MRALILWVVGGVGLTACGFNATSLTDAAQTDSAATDLLTNDLSDLAATDLPPPDLLMCTSPLVACGNTCADTTSDPLHCASCTPCGTRVGATATCTASVCSWACDTNYIDINGDIMATTSNGCECQIIEANDKPDTSFIDTNCDGLDGTGADAIFVAPMGHDGDDGSQAAPKQTLTAAIATAQSVSKDVYVMMGTYNEAVSLVSGVSLYGGFDTTWHRAANNLTVIQSPTSIGLDITHVNASTEVQLIKIVATDASTVGDSSYGIRLLNSNGPVLLNKVEVHAGAGANGMSGPPGGSGNAGGGGGNATGGAQPASAGPSTCGATGGAGAPVITGASDGASGGSGVSATDGASAGDGGTGGSGHASCGVIGSMSIAAPDDAMQGENGNAGASGAASAPFSQVDPSALYVPARGADGTDGQTGGGGGGGGSGAGASTMSGGMCIDVTSGGGGGGGGGGCSGQKGIGGGGAGGSFAITSVGSLLAIVDSALFTANGGNGGAGGSGGAGGAGGTGGTGSMGVSPAAAGAAGKRGGNGGNGGAGAGGAGGSTICILHDSGAPSSTNTSCTHGAAGLGGTSSGNAGAAGLAVDDYQP